MQRIDGIEQRLRDNERFKGEGTEMVDTADTDYGFPNRTQPTFL